MLQLFFFGKKMAGAMPIQLRRREFQIVLQMHEGGKIPSNAIILLPVYKNILDVAP